MLSLAYEEQEEMLRQRHCTETRNTSSFTFAQQFSTVTSIIIIINDNSNRFRILEEIVVLSFL